MFYCIVSRSARDYSTSVFIYAKQERREVYIHMGLTVYSRTGNY